METYLTQPACLSQREALTRTTLTLSTGFYTWLLRTWRWPPPENSWRTSEVLLGTETSCGTRQRTHDNSVLHRCSMVYLYTLVISLSFSQDDWDLQWNQGSMFSDRHHRQHVWWHCWGEEGVLLHCWQQKRNKSWALTLHPGTLQWSRWDILIGRRSVDYSISVCHFLLSWFLCF